MDKSQHPSQNCLLWHFVIPSQLTKRYSPLPPLTITFEEHISWHLRHVVHSSYKTELTRGLQLCSYEVLDYRDQ